MNQKAFYGLLLALFVPVISYFVFKNATQGAVALPRRYIYDSVINVVKNGKRVTDTVWHRLPDFSFTNQLGQRVGWNDIGRKAVVANFFFTRCPSICPRLTENTKLLQDHIKNNNRVGDRSPDFIHLLSFTVDPERDSVKQLKAWADRFGVNPENWWLLTGPKKEIYNLAVGHMKVPAVDGQGVDTNFIHTERMVLIDKNRHIRGYYHGLDTNDVKRLSRDIVLLSLEKDPERKGIFAGKLELLLAVFVALLLGLVTFFYFLKKKNI